VDVEKVTSGATEKVSALVATFGKSSRAPESITIAFHAKLSSWDNVHLKSLHVRGGSVHNTPYKHFTKFQPAFDSFKARFGNCNTSLPITFVGHNDGGAMATYAAVNFAETYPSQNVTLLTINTNFQWNYAYSKHIDSLISRVHRWRDASEIYAYSGSTEEEHEVWYVQGTMRCCLAPATERCMVYRGRLTSSIFDISNTFLGQEMFGTKVCQQLQF
jgi:hypothetical protein